MIKIEKQEVMGWEHVIRGMRNPMNSWDKSDSRMCCGDFCCNEIPGCKLACDIPHFVVGHKDKELMMKLRNAGTDHRKFMRMITVYLDITAPLYWWKEFDTYKVGTVANSCSTMHKIHEKEFTLDDFSREHLFHNVNDTEIWFNIDFANVLDITIFYLNKARELYLETNDKKYWWQMIQLLPTSYNQRRTIMLNYEVLANMYKSRKEHKLDEWKEFCKWIEQLPYSELITGEKQ
jgi:hypothetical protein